MDMLCFNHKYPLHCVETKREFKKFLGKVRSLDITCHCPDCEMELIYSLKVKGYKKGN